MAPKSATSTTKSERTLSTFVTFRVAGDALDPDEVTRLMEIRPTHAYRKGEQYSTGRSQVVAQTGVWMFSTDRITLCLNGERSTPLTSAMSSLTTSGSMLAKLASPA